MSSGKVVWVQPKDHARIKALSEEFHWDFGVVVWQALNALEREGVLDDIRKARDARK